MNSPCKDRDRKPNQRYRKSIIGVTYTSILSYKLNIFPVFTDRM